MSDKDQKAREEVNAKAAAEAEAAAKQKEKDREAAKKKPAEKGSVRVAFLKTVEVREDLTFEEGEIYDLRPDSAQHFASRGQCELV